MRTAKNEVNKPSTGQRNKRPVRAKDKTLLPRSLYLFKNGDGNSDGSDFGGVLLQGGGATTAIFEFNTIANNLAKESTANASGIHCTDTETLIRNTIVSGGTGGTGEIDNCIFEYSLGPAMPSGNNNSSASPTYVDVGIGDFHTAPDSPAVDAADPASTNIIDIDGETRVSGSAPDIGADELQ